MEEIDADKSKATYAWALFNNCCDKATQAEFDKLALVPLEGDSDRTIRHTERTDRSVLNS